MDRSLPAKLTVMAGLWAAAAVWAAGEATKATPAAEVAPPDPVAEAKRQFEAIRSQRRELVSDTELKLNIAPVPTLPADQPSSWQPRAASSLDAAKAEAKKSWLLDAMRPPGKTDDKSRRRGGDDTATAADFGFEKKSAEGLDSGPGESRTKGPTAPAVDPLRDYLAVWMTPADYALLVKPAKDRPGTALATDFPSGLAPLAMFGNGDAAASRMGADVAPLPADFAPRENPYLKSSQSDVAGFGPASGNPAALPSVAPEIKPLIPAGARPSEFVDPSKSAPPPALPDRLKPPDDKKYFPQLKRF